MTLIRIATGAAAALVMQGLATAAMAHTPYLLPNSFNPERTRVTLQAAQTEDDYFNPDIGLENPTYVAILPSGQQTELKPALILKDVAVTEAPLTEAGTYRFSTGQFVTRKTNLANVGGKWFFLRQPRPPRPGQPAPPPPGPTDVPPAGDGPPNVMYEANVPAGAPKMLTEAVMVAETYVSKGAPTDAALRTTGKGFELKPATHPNALYVDQGFTFQLLVDGKPFTGAQISVYRDGNIYDDKRIASEVKTDGKGEARIRFAQPGVYLLTTHYPAVATPVGDAPPPQTYVYSLTFEVTR